MPSPCPAPATWSSTRSTSSRILRAPHSSTSLRQLSRTDALMGHIRPITRRILPRTHLTRRAAAAPSTALVVAVRIGASTATGARAPPRTRTCRRRFPRRSSSTVRSRGTGLATSRTTTPHTNSCCRTAAASARLNMASTSRRANTAPLPARVSTARGAGRWWSGPLLIADSAS